MALLVAAGLILLKSVGSYASQKGPVLDEIAVSTAFDSSSAPFGIASFSDPRVPPLGVELGWNADEGVGEPGAMQVTPANSLEDSVLALSPCYRTPVGSTWQVSGMFKGTGGLSCWPVAVAWSDDSCQGSEYLFAASTLERPANTWFFDNTRNPPISAAGSHYSIRLGMFATHHPSASCFMDDALVITDQPFSIVAHQIPLSRQAAATMVLMLSVSGLILLRWLKG